MAATHQGERQGGDSRTSVDEHQRTFEGFIRFWAYLFGASILVLIFLAIFNS